MAGSAGGEAGVVRFDDLPLVEVVPLDPAQGAGLRVVISREDAPAPSDAAMREWEAMRVANPRLFPGSVLACMGFDEARGEILARRDSYVRVAVQPAVATGVRMLSVTAVMCVRGADGDRCVLMGKRGEGVRAYPGMWELGPSGGVGVPPRAVGVLEATALAASALDEISEEIGHGTASASRARAPIAIVRDAGAFSDDVVIPFDVQPGPDALKFEESWEYSQTAWVGLRQMEAFLRANEGRVIPPTVALCRTVLQ